MAVGRATTNETVGSSLAGWISKGWDGVGGEGVVPMLAHCVRVAVCTAKADVRLRCDVRPHTPVQASNDGGVSARARRNYATGEHAGTSLMSK